MWKALFVIGTSGMWCLCQNTFTALVSLSLSLCSFSFLKSTNFDAHFVLSPISMSQDDLWGSLKGEVGFHQVKTMRSEWESDRWTDSNHICLRFNIFLYQLFQESLLNMHFWASWCWRKEWINRTLEQKNRKTVWDFKTLIWEQGTSFCLL